MARSVPSIIFDRSGLELDDIVLEIVDNSLDCNSKHVYIKFFECTSSSPKSDVGFAVFDDGEGFGTTTKLFNSFEIQEKAGEKERKKEEGHSVSSRYTALEWGSGSEWVKCSR